MIMNKVLLCTLASLSLGSLVSGAETSNKWTVKVRAAFLETADSSNEFSALGIDFAADSIVVEDKWIPELDFAYAFTDNWVAELVLTVPQTHDVSLNGVGKLGTLEHLPPTLSIVYEFDTFMGLKPYLSSGLNMTWIMDSDLSVAGVELDLDDYSFGLALGAGVTYSLDDRWNLDASVKWMELDSNVSAGGAVLTNAQLDPFVYSFGFTYQF